MTNARSNRRRAAVVSFAPSFILGTCDFCHQHQQLVGECRIPGYRQVFIACMECGMSRTQARQQAIIRRALERP